MRKLFIFFVNKKQTESKLQVSVCRRNTPRWWREAGESGTKKLYQPEPRPVVYVIRNHLHFGEAAPHPCRGPRHHPCCDKTSQEGALSVWQV